MDWSKWRRLLRESSDNLETPQAQAEEAQGRPAESEAICGNQQRCLTEPYVKKEGSHWTINTI